jgi:hypothetical protein
MLGLIDYSLFPPFLFISQLLFSIIHGARKQWRARRNDRGTVPG